LGKDPSKVNDRENGFTKKVMHHKNLVVAGFSLTLLIGNDFRINNLKEK
jgi:hypothetical protein